MVVLLAALSAPAQMGSFGGAGNPAMNSTMAKLFGHHSAFSATAQFTINDSTHGKTMEMEMMMSMLEGKMRMETDMTKMKGADLKPQAAAQMKAMGMDKMITIMLPDKKVSLLLYPAFHAYVEMSTQNAQATESPDKNFKIEESSLGKETIDGHDCEKTKVVMTDDQGAHHEATVWKAADLKDFPIQMQMTERANDITIKYKDVKFEKPDANLFDAPSDFTKYNSMQTMMQTEMMKRMGGRGQ